MLAGETERNGYRNIAWRTKANWKAEYLLKGQSGLKNGIIAGGIERIGERNVD